MRKRPRKDLTRTLRWIQPNIVIFFFYEYRRRRRANRTDILLLAYILYIYIYMVWTELPRNCSTRYRCRTTVPAESHRHEHYNNARTFPTRVKRAPPLRFSERVAARFFLFFFVPFFPYKMLILTMCVLTARRIFFPAYRRRY